MAVTDYDFNQTRNDIINRAFRIVGVLSLGNTLSAEELDQGRTALNDMVKAWQARRIFLWTLVDGTQPLSVGVPSYALSTDPKILGLDQAYLQEPDDQRLRIISFREYQDIQTKTDPGDPEVVAHHFAESKIYVWPVPTVARVLYYTGIRALADLDSAGATPDFTPQWLQALTYGLAADLADEYKLPIAERDYLSKKATDMFAEARLGDRDRADLEFVENT